MEAEDLVVSSDRDKVLRANTIIIPETQRRTSDILSQYEYAQLISIRATEIAKTGIYDKSLEELKLSDPVDIAKAELKARKCTLTLRREVARKKNNGEEDIYIELWNPNEMITPHAD